MLIDIKDLDIPENTNCKILHIGASEAEEIDVYLSRGWDEVVWVEAIPEKYEIVCSKISNYPKMKAFKYAIWSISNKVFNFYQTNNGQSSSLYPLAKHAEVYPHIFVEKVINVSTITIDDLLSKHLSGWFPDFINLDIQGAEYDALVGGKSALKKAKYIYTEVSYENLYQDAALEPAVTKLLSKNNFSKYCEIKAMDSWGDAFYVKD